MEIKNQENLQKLIDAIEQHPDNFSMRHLVQLDGEMTFSYMFHLDQFKDYAPNTKCCIIGRAGILNMAEGGRGICDVESWLGIDEKTYDYLLLGLFSIKTMWASPKDAVRALRRFQTRPTL